MVKAEYDPDTMGSVPMICTKFAPLPWKLGRQAVVDACKESCARLGVDQIDAYMIHWPGVWQNEEYYEGASPEPYRIRGYVYRRT